MINWLAAEGIFQNELIKPEINFFRAFKMALIWE